MTYVRIALVWLGLLVVAGLLVYGDTLGWSVHERPLPGFFLANQDLPALLGILAGLGAILIFTPVVTGKAWPTDEATPGQ